MSDLGSLLRLLESGELIRLFRGLSAADQQVIKQLGQALSVNLNPEQQQVVNELIRTLIGNLDDEQGGGT
ncbi:MAG: hypothetical protein GX182_02940 [Firmicutes bacterium]|nr:hypothetical protein [Bacillota bacterium]